MTSYLYIKIKNQPESKIIKKFQELNISIYDLQRKEKYIYIKILAEDYEKLQKYLKTLNFQKVRYTGPDYFKKTFKRYRMIIISLIISVFSVVICSNVIVDIKVIHEDKDLVELITSELEIYNVKKFTFKKSYNYLQKVKAQIKNKHLDKIDWLEINKVGMRYIVRLEERIITSENDLQTYCHVYASKDALVKNVKVTRGEAIVNMNDYVKKGDLLISGDIHLNEEIVNNVCASGTVEAEVWYEINLKVPFDHYETIKTGKKRTNIIVNYNGIDYKLFKDRLDKYEENRKLIFDLLGIKIYLKTDEEIIRKKLVYSQDEVIDNALKLAEQKLKDRLSSDARIVSKKILQNRVIDSTMDIDIFIVVREDISTQVALGKEAENGLWYFKK